LLWSWWKGRGRNAKSIRQLDFSIDWVNGELFFELSEKVHADEDVGTLPFNDHQAELFLSVKMYHSEAR